MIDTTTATVERLVHNLMVEHNAGHGDEDLPEACAVLRQLIKERDALAAQVAQVAGWRMVPVEPTEAMIKAGGHANSEWLNDNAPLNERRYALPMESVWKALLAAAPPPPGSV